MSAHHLGVVGWPIAHSRSPTMHSAALRTLGLANEFDYRPFAVAPDQLSSFIGNAATRSIVGLNITIPHKETALSLCQPDALALEVGAVNTLTIDNGSIVGTNTDVHGFRMLLNEIGADGSSRVLILGAGGATRAVIAALLPTARSISLLSRRARSLMVSSTRFEAQPWQESTLRTLLHNTDLLVDATPRGLDPNSAPIELGPLPAHAIVVDLVVRRETALVAAAHSRGLTATTGTAMLLHQGAASLEQWIGRPVPLTVMRTALDAALD